MTPRKSDDNLFKKSTMTFGEHLEELRVCLWRAVIGLMIGFLFGLGASPWVVEFIQTPLEKALSVYEQKQSAKNIEEKLPELHESGYLLPANSELIKELIQRENLMVEEVYVNPSELFRQLQETYPEQFEEIQLPSNNPDETFKKSDLMHIFVWRSIKPIRAKSLNPPEPFAIYIKAALLVGIVAASPWIFYQIWSFVAAGLYRRERSYVHVFFPMSLALFVAGASTAFFFVFQPVLRFLFAFNEWLNIDPDPRISEWVSFALVLPLGFGISFQLPLVMLFMERIGIFTVQSYLSQWRVAILVIFVIAMFLTPIDPQSMLLMALPLSVLYFGGVLLCHLMPRRRSPFDEPEDEFV